MEIAADNPSWREELRQPAHTPTWVRERPDEGPRTPIAGLAQSASVSEHEGDGVEKERHCAPRLFDVLQGSGVVAPFLVPLGADAEGRLIWLDLHQETSHHVLVAGGSQTARAEMIRALAIGLTVTTRPALLQLLAIDATGRELSVLETLPHAVTDTATHSSAAQISLAWLAAELEARRRDGRRWPEMLLVIENLKSLAGPQVGRGRAALMAILRFGGASGMHVLAGAEAMTGGLRSAGWSRPDVAKLTVDDRSGWMTYSRRGLSSRIVGVRVAAVDLDLVARGRRPTRAETIGFTGARPENGGPGNRRRQE